MAVLKNLVTKETQLLDSQHTVGRNVMNKTCISAKDVSRTHATLFWENGDWFLRDHSRNGTKVKGEFISNTIVRLQVNCNIQFGASESTIWRLLSNSPPSSYLQSSSDQNEVLELTNHTLYPNHKKPAVSFYLSQKLKWEIDNGYSTEELIHGQQYSFGNTQWVFHENEPLENTIDNQALLGKALLTCNLSSDEETVQVTISVNDLRFDLGEKVYNHLLLILIRKRIGDLGAGYSEEEQGWLFVEQLLKELSKELVRNIDVYYLNIMIHRFRNHLKNLKPYGHLFANVIQRKKGRLRINYPRIKLLKADKEIESYQSLTPSTIQVKVKNNS